MKRAYITGATGAIGMALVDKLIKEGVKVTVFVRPESMRLKQLKIYGDSLRIEPAALDKLAEYGLKNTQEVKNTDEELVFYHLGWSGTFGAERNDADMQQKNVEYTLDAVALAKRLGCGVFIGAGSQAEYGRVSGVLAPETETNPENEYGKAKLRAGIESRLLCDKLGIRHSWVRILSVYGPYDGSRTMVMSVIAGLLKGEEALLTQGIQTWDYLYSEDAASALYLLGDKNGLVSECYCLGSGIEKKLKYYIIDICNTVGADTRLLKFGAVEYGDKQVMRLVADISKLTKDTGFVPEYSFGEGISKTVEWVKNTL